MRKLDLASLEMTDETQDRWYLNLYKEVREHPEDHREYKTDGGKLYIYRSDLSIEDLLEDQGASKLLVPKEHRQTVLSEYHEEPTAGHFGRRKTYKRLAIHYYWPSIYKDVAKYVKGYEICQQCKVKQLLPAGLMGKRIITRPWESVSGDCMGPYPRIEKCNVYHIVFTDTFTKWAENIPVRVINERILKRENSFEYIHAIRHL